MRHPVLLLASLLVLLLGGVSQQSDSQKNDTALIRRANAMLMISRAGEAYTLLAESNDVRAKAMRALILSSRSSFQEGAPEYAPSAAAEAMKPLIPELERRASSDPLCARLLGTAYVYGIGVGKDERKALELYIQAAKGGDPLAKSNVSICFSQGLGTAQDDQEAYRWSRRAASAHNAEAFVQLHLMLEEGRGVKQNTKGARYWLDKAVQAGHTDAMYFMFWEPGQPGQEKLHWLRLASALGNAHASYSLAAELAAELSSAARVESAHLFKIAADKQIGTASLRYAKCLRRGLGVELDWRAAMEYVERAEEFARQDEDLETAEEAKELAASWGPLFAKNALPTIDTLPTIDRSWATKYTFHQQTDSESTDLPDVIERAIPAVFTITSTQGSGTGFLINEKGIGITNRHVIEGTKEFDAEFSDGKKVRAKVIGVAEGIDLALVKLSGVGYPFVPLHSGAELRLGDTVIAIGAPYGLDHSVSRGIVSSLRKADGVRIIQTDAPVNPGNSGGPLISTSGAVVGVITWKVRDPQSEGLGFAISIDEVIERLPLVPVGAP